MAQQVPLVIYENGERRVIGTATATWKDGKWEISAEIDPAVTELFFLSDIDNYSIGTEIERENMGM